MANDEYDVTSTHPSQGGSTDTGPVDTGTNATGIGADEKYCTSCGSVIKAKAELCPNCGVNQGQSAAATQRTPSPPSGRYIAGFVGSVVSFIGGWILPIVGQVCGGIVAGYLRGSDNTESAISGALSGLFAAIPAALLVLLLMFLGLLGSFADGDAATGIAGIVLFGGILVFVVGFYVVFGAVGGLVGAAITDRAAPEE